MNLFKYQTGFSNRSNEQIINAKLEDFENYIYQNRIHFMSHGKRSQYKNSQLKRQSIEDLQEMIKIKSRDIDIAAGKRQSQKKIKYIDMFNSKETTKNYHSNMIRQQSHSKQYSNSKDRNRSEKNNSFSSNSLKKPYTRNQSSIKKNNVNITNVIKFEGISEYLRNFQKDLTQTFELLTQKIVKLQYKVAMYQRHFNAIQLSLKFKTKQLKNSQIEKKYLDQLNEDLQNRMDRFKQEYMEAQEELGISKLIQQIQKVKQRLKGHEYPNIQRSPTFDCAEFEIINNQQSQNKIDQLILEQHGQVVQSFRNIEEFIAQLLEGQPSESTIQLETLKFKLQNSLLLINDFLSLKVQKEYPRQVHQWIEKILMQNIQLKTQISLSRLQNDILDA